MKRWIYPYHAGALFALVLTGWTATAWAQPINDSVLFPTIVGSLPYTDNTIDNTLATYEGGLGEPLASCGTDGLNSVWWTYTPGSDVTLLASTIGSNFDTILTIIVSPAIEVGCDDDSGGGTGQSQLLFSATGGTSYYFRVVGYGANSGNVVFNLSEVTPDDLAGAVAVTALPFSDTLSSVGAGLESGEVIASCSGGGTASIWWSFTAPETMPISANTVDSNFDTILSVHTGTSHPLSEVACDDDGGPGLQSALTFMAEKDTTYYFRIAGFDGATGEAILNVERTPPDLLIGAVEVTEPLPFTDTQSNVGAGIDPGEVSTSCGPEGGNSVWWKYTPSFSRGIIIDTNDSDFDTVLGLFSGSDHPLVELTCDDDSGTGTRSRLIYYVTGGQTYYVRVTGYGGASGNIGFKVSDLNFAFAGTVLLQGAYDTGGQMAVTGSFASAIPTHQPYSDAAYDGSILDYDGADSVSSVPAGMIDWLLISLRSSTSAGSEVQDSEQAAILMEDGSIVAADGDSVRFPGFTGLYYVVLRHRNHLSVMSSSPVDFSGGHGVWDFTTAGQAYSGGGTAMATVDTGLFGMFAADAGFDGQVTANDFNTWLTATKAAVTGYVQADFNLDGQVTANDFNTWLTNTKVAAASQVPE